jgi:hypothetical protein
VRWELTADQVERLAAGPVTVVCWHPAYRVEAVLGDESRTEPPADRRGGG